MWTKGWGGKHGGQYIVLQKRRVLTVVRRRCHRGQAWRQTRAVQIQSGEVQLLQMRCFLRGPED